MIVLPSGCTAIFAVAVAAPSADAGAAASTADCCLTRVVDRGAAEAEDVNCALLLTP
jgi:hypothetical protein